MQCNARVLLLLLFAVSLAVLNAGRGVRESRKRIAKKDLDSCRQEAMTGGFTGLEQGERASS